MTETDGEVTALVHPVPASNHGGLGIADDEAFLLHTDTDGFAASSHVI